MLWRTITRTTITRALPGRALGRFGRLLLMTYVAAPDRYQQTHYRRCGRSGIDLPEVSLGLWHNFGNDRPLETQRAILRRAFDLGVTHFDLANNYGGEAPAEVISRQAPRTRRTARRRRTSAGSWPRTCARTATS